MGTRASTPEGRSGTPPRPLRLILRRPFTPDPDRPGPRHVVVVVLGDVGRSPRMQYHALSLASHGVLVTLVGYKGERCIAAVRTNPLIEFHRFDAPLSGAWGKKFKQRAYLVFAITKACALVFRLVRDLTFRVDKPDAIMVQNPPSLPGLACVYMACLLRSCPMVLDWHNLGFTMFGRGARHPFVCITRMAEGFFGRRAHLNLAVSRAMRDWIKRNFGVREAYVVYDQPPEVFRTPTLQERHALFLRLAKTNQDYADAIQAFNSASYRDNDDRNPALDSNQHHPGRGRREEPIRDPRRFVSGRRGDSIAFTPFTTLRPDGAYEVPKNRPALLVSSTSWTPDEDFSVLLEALVRLDARAASGASPTLPFVLVMVTGKGPDKAKYVERMKAIKMSRVAVCTAWLEPDDYPILLGSADLGICLHTSTSGIDLPMKVVDMFGCGVPVCAIHFECLHELVQDGYNGSVFKDSTELALRLEALLDGFPRAGCELEGYRSNVKEVKRWNENWDQYAWPLFESMKSLSRNTNRRASRRQTRGRARTGGGGGWTIGTAIEAALVPLMVVVFVLVLTSASIPIPWLPDWLKY